MRSPFLHFRKSLVIVLIPIWGFVQSNAQTVSFQWAKQMGGTMDDNSYCVATDHLGNVYTTGTFKGVADFDPGAATFNLTSFGLADIYVSKLDASGNFVWAKQIGGASIDMVNAITVDTAGNVYITGFFQGTADFDPGAGTLNLTSAGVRDIFVCKLNASGNLVWAKQFAGTADEQAKAIALDAAGNVYTTGYFTGTVDFDPGAGVSSLTTSGSNDIYVSKLDASGNFVWVKQMGGTSADIGYGIALDTSGNIYTTGNFTGTADFDPGTGTSNLTSNGSSDMFISKLDASGNFVWAKQIGGTLQDFGNAIALDASGNVYTTGFFEDTADFDPGAGTSNLISFGAADIYVLKLTSSGNFAWAKQMGGTSGDYGNSIALDAAGNVYTSGTFYGTSDFDPGTGTVNLTSFGNTDIFISKLDASGNFVWAKQMGGSGYDWCDHVVLDGSANIYVTGFFDSTSDFDPGAGTNNLTSAGGLDAFVAKLSQTTGIEEQQIDADISIYPNPTNKYIVVEKSNGATYTISGLDGKLWEQGDIQSSKQEIHINALPAGLYLLQLRNKAGEYKRFKILKE